jgi:hypothetical protein
MGRRRIPKNTGWVLDVLALDQANHTELVQIARELGHPHANRQVPQEDLIDLILGADFPVEDPLAEIREKIYAHVTGNSIMLSGLDCSVHCPTCPHDRVVACFAENSDLVLPPEENPIT